jgi:hypothetical protein
MRCEAAGLLADNPDADAQVKAFFAGNVRTLES